MSLIKLVENSNSDNLYSKPESCGIKGFFKVQEHHAHRHFFLLKSSGMWSVRLIYGSVTHWHDVVRIFICCCLWCLVHWALVLLWSTLIG
jgi:hypothetical protein